MADFMSTDYSSNTGGGYTPLPEGNYEMIINNVQETATKNGAESLQIDLLVRNDLDKVEDLKETNAKYHNRHVFVDNWKRKVTNQYDIDGFQYILQAVKVPEGTPLHTVEDFMKLIKGAAVRVFVKVEDNTYKGKTTEQNRVAPWNFDVTKFPEIQHEFKGKKPAASKPVQSAQPATTDPFAANGTDENIDITDDDVPF